MLIPEVTTPKPGKPNNPPTAADQRVATLKSQLDQVQQTVKGSGCLIDKLG